MKNKQDDITAYVIDDSFNLSVNDKKEIDLDKDGAKDVLIELREIKPNPHSIKSAGFFIQKVNAKEAETILANGEENTETSSEIITGNEIQEPISEPVIILEKDSKEQPTFFEKIINFFKGMFRWR